MSTPDRGGVCVCVSRSDRGAGVGSGRHRTRCAPGAARGYPAGVGTCRVVDFECRQKWCVRVTFVLFESIFFQVSVSIGSHCHPTCNDI